MSVMPRLIVLAMLCVGVLGAVACVDREVEEAPASEPETVAAEPPVQEPETIPETVVVEVETDAAPEPAPQTAQTIRDSFTPIYLEPGRYVATTRGYDSTLRGEDGQDWCSLWLDDETGGVVDHLRPLEASGTYTIGFSVSTRDGSGPFYVDESICGGPFSLTITSAPR